MEYKDYYQILGVSKDATQDEIKRAYRKLARKYHPDVSSENDAEEHFKEVGEAYEVLKDVEKRAAYDQLGSQWKDGQSGFQPPPGWDAGFEFHNGNYTGTGSGPADFSEFFETLFGQGNVHYSSAGGRSHANFQMRGEDSHAKVFINLEDAYLGATRSISLRTTELGKDGRPHLKDRKLNIKIPKGVRQGQHIRLQGQGGAGIGGSPNGDLYLEIEFNAHSIYKVEGKDVSLELPITPWEAALGCKLTIPTPAGKFEIKIPAGVSSGKRLRLKERGIPGKRPGDFFVLLKIVLSEHLSEKEKSLYEELKSETINDNPRAKLGI